MLAARVEARSGRGRRAGVSWTLEPLRATDSESVAGVRGAWRTDPQSETQEHGPGAAGSLSIAHPPGRTHTHTHTHTPIHAALRGEGGHPETLSSTPQAPGSSPASSLPLPHYSRRLRPRSPWPALWPSTSRAGLTAPLCPQPHLPVVEGPGGRAPHEPPGGGHAAGLAAGAAVAPRGQRRQPPARG